jgi:glycyl-tRNA synthetase alpha chain
MYLQGVTRSPKFNGTIHSTHGDVHLQGEIEQSTYNFEAGIQL